MTVPLGTDGAHAPIIPQLSIRAALGEICGADLATLALTVAVLDCAQTLTEAIVAEIYRRSVLR